MDVIYGSHLPSIKTLLPPPTAPCPRSLTRPFPSFIRPAPPVPPRAYITETRGRTIRRQEERGEGRKQRRVRPVVSSSSSSSGSINWLILNFTLLVLRGTAVSPCSLLSFLLHTNPMQSKDSKIVSGQFEKWLGPFLGLYFWKGIQSVP